MKTLLYSLLFVFFSALLRGDIIELENGMRIKGHVVSETDSHLTVQRTADTVTLKKTSVKTVVRSFWEIELEYGIRMSGEILEEDGDMLRIRSSLNSEPVEVRKSDIRSRKEKRIPHGFLPKRGRIRPERLIELRTEAIGHLNGKRYSSALSVYRTILTAYPEDTNALYNVACVLSRMGHARKALEFLKNAVDWGFIDFSHICADPDLARVRRLQEFGSLLEHKEDYIRRSQSNTVSIISEQLLEKGVWVGNYSVLSDPENMISYVYAMPDSKLAEIRTRLEAYAEIQWKNLFAGRPGSPVYVVLLSRKDTPKILKGIGGLFNPATNILYCGSSGFNSLLNSSVVMHEFTHALHWGDANARLQVHPMWLQEGLATLFESSELRGNRAVPVHSYRLGIVQNALVRDASVPWEDFFNLDYYSFMRGATICYAQARYILMYFDDLGKLREFYREYTEDEAYNSELKTSEVFKKVFKKDMADVERDWEAWIMKQHVPELPFLGIKLRLGPTHVQVGELVHGGAAYTAGLRAGDIISEADGTGIECSDDLFEMLSRKKPGDIIELSVMREGRKLHISVTLAEKSKGIKAIEASKF